MKKLIAIIAFVGTISGAYGASRPADHLSLPKKYQPMLGAYQAYQDDIKQLQHQNSRKALWAGIGASAVGALVIPIALNTYVRYQVENGPYIPGGYSAGRTQSLVNVACGIGLWARCTILGVAYDDKKASIQDSRRQRDVVIGQIEGQLRDEMANKESGSQPFGGRFTNSNTGVAKLDNTRQATDLYGFGVQPVNLFPHHE